MHRLTVLRRRRAVSPHLQPSRPQAHLKQEASLENISRITNPRPPMFTAIYLLGCKRNRRPGYTGTSDLCQPIISLESD
jgi:hypothetical protein